MEKEAVVEGVDPRAYFMYEMFLHLQDGHSSTSIVVAAYLLFLGTFLSPTVPLKLFSLKRNPELPPITGIPGQLRYVRFLDEWVEP